jgi:hypothetical protein
MPQWDSGSVHGPSVTDARGRIAFVPLSFAARRFTNCFITLLLYGLVQNRDCLDLDQEIRARQTLHHH